MHTPLKDWNDAYVNEVNARKIADTVWKENPTPVDCANNVDLDSRLIKPEPVRPLDLHEFLALNIKPRAMLLKPVLPEKGLAMLYGPRGVGKTALALSTAYAVASGGSVFGWTAPAPRYVLYVDGEMPEVTLQERLAGIVASSEQKVAERYFQILAADRLENGLPNLAGEAGQKFLDPFLRGISLLVVDNISTLASMGRDNDFESWGPVQEWLLRLRRRGISVLLLHHAGKGGQQRGTSRREDVLDTVISLKRPQDYCPTEGARFEVHLEKARGIFGEEAKPIEAKLQTVDNKLMWTTRDLPDVELSRVVELTNEGLSVRDIAEEVGISKSKVQRLKVRAVAEGRLETA